MTRIADILAELELMGIPRSPEHTDAARKLVLHVLDDHKAGDGFIFATHAHGYASAIADLWCATNRPPE